MYQLMMCAQPVTHPGEQTTICAQEAKTMIDGTLYCLFHGNLKGIKMLSPTNEAAPKPKKLYPA